MFDKRISIFTGNFGSGKTEVALNYVTRLSKMVPDVTIVDLDVVNPFFRTSDISDKLKTENISVISPVFAGTNMDVPALSSDINRVFEKKSVTAVFDVGGDDLGATILSRYKDRIVAEDYEMFFVINIMRPETKDAKSIINMIKSIENASRIHVTKLINNTNLLKDTSASDILRSKEIMEEISRKLGISVGFVSGFYDVINPIEKEFDCDILYLEKKLKLPWE